jgi:hypothetical protein
MRPVMIESTRSAAFFVQDHAEVLASGRQHRGCAQQGNAVSVNDARVPSHAAR